MPKHPKHEARRTRVSRRLERQSARERGQWFLKGKPYPSAPGKHAAEVPA